MILEEHLIDYFEVGNITGDGNMTEAQLRNMLFVYPEIWIMLERRALDMKIMFQQRSTETGLTINDFLLLMRHYGFVADMFCRLEQQAQVSSSVVILHSTIEFSGVPEV